MSYSCHLQPDKNWNLTISYVPIVLKNSFLDRVEKIPAS